MSYAQWAVPAPLVNRFRGAGRKTARAPGTPREEDAKREEDCYRRRRSRRNEPFGFNRTTQTLATLAPWRFLFFVARARDE